MSEAALAALPAHERGMRLATSRKALLAAGADVVIDSVADLMPALATANA